MKLIFALLILSACGVADETSVTQELRCDDWGCGTNSASVGDGLIFDELDRTGAVPNRAGLVLTGATAGDGTPVQISVRRQDLIATTFDGLHEYRGIALVNTVIRLKHAVTGVRYEVLVAAVREKAIAFWEGDPDAVPFYELMTRKAYDGTEQPAPAWELACREEVIEPRWTGVEHMALVFEGDRYDAVHKTVTETPPGDPWFNIACARTAPAKLHLMRHTRAGSFDAYGVIRFDTSEPKRQTLLKMLTADYCGTGHSFTVDGTPLVYNANQPWYVEERLWAAKEALWDQKGATCLETPRLAEIDGITTTAAIALECSLPPSCAERFTDWQSSAYVMSALLTPPPPPIP